MKSRIIKTILLAILFLFFASWFYKIVVLMLLAHTWRKEIKAMKKRGITKEQYVVVPVDIFESDYLETVK